MHSTNTVHRVFHGLAKCTRMYTHVCVSMQMAVTWQLIHCAHLLSHCSSSLGLTSAPSSTSAVVSTSSISTRPDLTSHTLPHFHNVKSTGNCAQNEASPLPLMTSNLLPQRLPINTVSLTRMRKLKNSVTLSQRGS